MLFTSATLLAAMAMSASAAKPGRTFAVNHFYGKGPLTTGRADPIINPGVPSSHHHTIQGGSAFGLTMTDTQLLTSTCTSSLVKNDKSNYWYPSLFFQDPADGSFTPVPLFYMNVYYFFEATDDVITAFEPGHRMVIGSPKLRSPPPGGAKLVLNLKDGAPQPVQWTCPRSNTNVPLYPPNSDGLHGVGIGDLNNKGAGAGFSDKNCDGYASPLRADIHFPSCYDPSKGKDSYQNNMQFPSSAGASAGGRANCPPGWIHTPHLFYEVYWNTELFKDKWTQGQGKHPWVLSNGDTTGYSLHADFISGWDVATLQQIIDHCDAGDSGMDKCPGLIGGLNDAGTSCNIPSPGPEALVINSKLVTKLTALPGNNPLTGYGSGPGSVSGSPPGGSSGSGSGPGTGTTSAAPAPAGSSTASAPHSSSKPGSGTGTGPGPNPKSSAAPGTTSAAPAPAGSSTASAPHSSSKPGSGPNPKSSAAPETTPSSSSKGSTPTSAPQDSAAPVLTANVTSPHSSASIPGWSHYGCFSDKLGGGNRVLSGITFANVGSGDVTTTKCIAYCDKKGFSMAGTEYGGQCFCGNALVGSTELAESECDVPCEGDGEQTCGGQLALTVFKKSGSTRRRRHLSAHTHKHFSQPL